MFRSLGILPGMREVLGPRMALALLGFQGLSLSAHGEKSCLGPLRSKQNPKALDHSLPVNHGLKNRQQPEQNTSTFRNVSSRKLPLDLLEEFRKDYPAAVDLEWQYREISAKDTMSLQPSDTLERLLILRFDSGTYRVQGYNLGQFFAATYLNNRRQSYAVLNSCEGLDAYSKSAWQSAYPDWTCLAFTRIYHHNKEWQQRILISRPDRHHTLILSIDSDGKARAIGQPKHWKRMRYARMRHQSQRLRLLITTP